MGKKDLQHADRRHFISRTPEGNIALTLQVIPGKISEDFFAFHDVGEFEEFLNHLRDMEGQGSAGGVNSVEFLSKLYLKREGYMEGGALMGLGVEAINDDWDVDPWEVEAVEGDEIDEFELISATVNLEIPYSNMSDEKAKVILNSRDFWIELRKRMHEPAFESTGGSYYIQIERYVDLVEAGLAEFRLNYHVGDDAYDLEVKIFKTMIEHWDDKEQIEAVATDVFNSLAGAPEELEQPDFEGQRIAENRSVSGQRLFNNWRRFLNQ